MSLRLFAALDIPDDAASRLVALMRGVPGARWRPRENLHLTLRFFGEVAEPVADDLDAELSTLAARTGPFDLKLRGAGFFGGAAPNALWVGVAPNEALVALVAQCERAARRCGLRPESRPFAPHVTLAYLAGTPIDHAIGFEKRYALFESDTWRVDAFTLVSSHVRRDAPSLYREEALYPLTG